ncbi:hypothetical protein [Actinacidiphila soli]|uniref:hypothetical protein n=1 Tax=Actinacidiphila soli TaxID=2487275 RepID=UPI0013E3A247|nr:hypothetical protein [Actinacidiphila soli]
MGYGVFQYTSRNHTGAPTRGDLVGAITAAVSVISAAVLLLGMSADGDEVPSSDRGHQEVSTSAPGR